MDEMVVKSTPSMFFVGSNERLADRVFDADTLMKAKPEYYGPRFDAIKELRDQDDGYASQEAGVPPRRVSCERPDDGSGKACRSCVDERQEEVLRMAQEKPSVQDLRQSWRVKALPARLLTARRCRYGNRSQLRLEAMSTTSPVIWTPGRTPRSAHICDSAAAAVPSGGDYWGQGAGQDWRGARSPNLAIEPVGAIVSDTKWDVT